MTIWDEGIEELPEEQREALQLAQESEPDEIDLAPGTEPPPGDTIPIEPPLRTIQERKRESRRAAERLWEEVKRRIHGLQRMIALRVALLLLVLPSLAGAQQALRIDPPDQPSTDRAHYAAETTCGLQAPETEQLRDLTAEQVAENAIHEAVHRWQLAGNCDSVMAVWDRDLLARVTAEAEASCAGWKAGNVPRSLWHARGVQAAAWWARFSTVGYDQAIAAFDKACGS